MSNEPQAIIKITDFGVIKVQLYWEKAPKTVDNFIKLAESKFYNGLIFHRVINGFMVQGGGFNEDFVQKRTPSIPGEFAANGWKKNDIKHSRGVLSMARTSDPNSASSQFFIMHKDSPHLDGQYAAFGKVIEGIEVVDEIADVDVGSHKQYDDVPYDPVVIESITILQSGD